MEITLTKTISVTEFDELYQSDYSNVQRAVVSDFLSQNDVKVFSTNGSCTNDGQEIIYTVKFNFFEAIIEDKFSNAFPKETVIQSIIETYEYIHSDLKVVNHEIVSEKLDAVYNTVDYKIRIYYQPINN